MSDVQFTVSVNSQGATDGLAKVGAGLERVGDAAAGAQRGAAGASAATDKLGRDANAAGELVKNLGAAIAGAFTFKELVDAAAKMESIRSGLQAVSKDATQASADFEFIRKTATAVGADVTEVGRAFLGLAAATKGTAVEGEATRQVFEAVASAMSKAGKSSAETQNALTAIAQIASKGTVSMEELRGQLGEALPGALQAAAKGLGITTEDLIKLTEQGQIAAQDLFPALTKGLNDLYGTQKGAQTLAQEITNIKNALVELATNIGEAGGLDALKAGAEVAQTALVLLDDALVTTGKTIGTLAGAIATLNFSQLPAAFAEIETASREKLLKAAEHNEVLRKYVEAVGNEALQTELKTRALQKATTAQGEEAAKTGVSMVALVNAYSKVTTEIQGQIEAAEKSVIAREAEGKAAVQIAELLGDEKTLRQEQAAAAKQSSLAADEEAKQRLTLVNVLQGQREAIVALATEAGTLETDANKKRLKELDDLILKRQTESEKATAQAAGARASAAAAQIEAESLKDNSARVDELRQRYADLQPAMLEANTLRKAGLPISAELAAKEIEGAKAAALLKDALNDQRTALEANNAAKAANIDAAQAAVKVSIAQQKAAYDLAQAQGDERGAAEALLQIRRLEIELLQLTAEAKRAEAEASRLVLKADLEEMRSKGDLTEAQKADIAAREARIRVLEAEAKIAGISAQSARDVAIAIAQSGQASAVAIGGMEDYASALEGVADSAERAGYQVGRLKAVQRDDGRGAIVGKYEMDALQTLKFKRDAGTLKASDLELALTALQTAKNNQQTAMSAGPFAPQGAAAASYASAVADAENLVGLLRGMNQRTDNRGGTAGAGSAAGAQPVVINIGGTQRKINVASRADASALAALLQELENAKQRGGG